MILVEGEATACPLTLKESNMTIDECMTLEVYAEQYGVRSESKAYTVCYNSKYINTLHYLLLNRSICTSFHKPIINKNKMDILPYRKCFQMKLSMSQLTRKCHVAFSIRMPNIFLSFF